MVSENNLSLQEDEKEVAGMTEDQFWNSPLDEEEQWYEDHFDEFRPCENQAELRNQLMEAAHNKMEEIRGSKKQISINIDGRILTYFKALSAETGIAYQSLINMFLLQCVNEKKRPVFA